MKNEYYVTMLRFIHLLIVIYLFIGMFYIYYSAITRTADFVLYLFVISLTIEGIIIYVNRGNCPFGIIQRKYGDDVPFFELILPKKYAKEAVKVCAVVTLIGMALVLCRFLLTS